MHDLLRFIIVLSLYVIGGCAFVAVLMWILSWGVSRARDRVPLLPALLLGRLFPRLFPLYAPSGSAQGVRASRQANQFKTARAAMEYLAGRLVEEAERAGTPLSEVERKMLYFTESGWTPPGMMAVNEEFERSYNQDEYEQKIGTLASKTQERDAEQDQQAQIAWDDAVLKLSEGDHHILILIDGAPSAAYQGDSRRAQLRRFMPTQRSNGPRESGDMARLVVTALVLLFACFLLPLFLHWIFGPGWDDKLRHFLR